MSDRNKTIKLHIAGAHNIAQWDRDIAIIQGALHITGTSQAIRTAVRMAALSLRKLAMTSGEQVRIYPSGDTWTLQIGDNPANIVEGLPGAQAALDLIINA